MATITGDAAGNREPMTTQQMSTPQKDRIRMRHVRPEAFPPATAASACCIRVFIGSPRRFNILTARVYLHLDQGDLFDLAEPPITTHQRHGTIHRCRGDSRVRDLEPVEPR